MLKTTLVLALTAAASSGASLDGWRLVLNDFFVLAFAVFLVRFVAVEASYQRAKRTASGVRYPVGIGLRIGLRAGGPFLIFVAYKTSQEAATVFDWVVVAAVAFLGFAAIFSEPGEIVTKPGGLSQKTWLGLRSRNIPWEGAAARHVPGLRELLIIGNDGTAITHSQYHVGQEQLLTEIERHGVFLQR